MKNFYMLAILIACLGSYGLAACLMRRRTKEISICQVLGARALMLVFQFSYILVILLLLAIVIVVLVTAYHAGVYLESYAYRIDTNVGLYMMQESYVH